MTIGIYKISNKIDGRYYIGSSKNIEKRWKTHKSHLKNKKHCNIFLQRAYNKYGISNFELTILLECSKDDLFKIEQDYLNHLDDNAYNLAKQAKGGDNISYHLNRKEIIEKMKISCKNAWNNFTPEQKRLLSESRSGENNGMFGKHHSKETIEKISFKIKEYYITHESIRKGKNFDSIYTPEKAKELRSKFSKIASQRVGEKNPFYGKKHSQEFKLKLSELRKGQYNGSQNIPFTIDGVRYESLSQAAKILNLHITVIRWRLLSKNKKFENYKYCERNEQDEES